MEDILGQVHGISLALIFPSKTRGLLTKHFSILCILRHDVQHVFGLHDLREREKREDIKATSWVMGMTRNAFLFLFSHPVQSSPGSFGHQTFSNHRNPPLIFPCTLVPHTHTCRHHHFHDIPCCIIQLSPTSPHASIS